ncbi:hypothetical protein FB45DRAFT_860133 [Roridomyces roridus]|uniref:Uncharacterized protein n=1 Tax=Roridomyces roridus TaxID=1738132 RepID=A0AAD7CE92_9AGAR|nr:hypothetical protein FB45DRAFT_860133 [Roridomyces roridus]
MPFPAAMNHDGTSTVFKLSGTNAPPCRIRLRDVQVPEMFKSAALTLKSPQRATNWTSENNPAPWAPPDPQLDQDGPAEAARHIQGPQLGRQFAAEWEKHRITALEGAAVLWRGWSIEWNRRQGGINESRAGLNRDVVTSKTNSGGIWSKRFVDMVVQEKVKSIRVSMISRSCADTNCRQKAAILPERPNGQNQERFGIAFSARSNLPNIVLAGVPSRGIQSEDKSR